MHRALIVAMATAFLVIANLASPAMADGCGNNIQCTPPPPTSSGDQAGGAVVTTGVQFPGVGADSALGRATAANASCSDCEWTISPACIANGPSDDAMCQGAATACTAPAVRYRVYLRHPGEPWQLVDTICLGPDQKPASVADVGQLVRERVVNLLPDAAPTFQPADGGLVNLPTLFAAGEPRTFTTRSFDVLGFTVVVTATAHWDWTFEPGVTQGFDVPGGGYPDTDVSYTYADPGTRGVVLTTSWAATFTVDGDGPFQVPGPQITKTAGPVPVPVREAHSVLVGG
jgi:hypothetical protein